MPTGLELFVDNVRSYSQRGKFRELIEDVMSPSVEVLLVSGRCLDNVLEIFTYEEHSLGILIVLYVKFQVISSYGTANLDDYEPLLYQVQDFVTGCNEEQIKFAPDVYAELFHSFTQVLVRYDAPLRGIKTLCRAIRKIQSCNSQLTSIHGDLCQLSLLSKCFKPALEFLDTDVTDISREEGQFDSEHFLLYYYYGGMIYTALKNYDRALYFFEACITITATDISRIMMEAYNKYILVSLIRHGKILKLPLYTSSVVFQYLRVWNRRYYEFAEVYHASNCEVMKSFIAQNEYFFKQDGNMGLVKQVLKCLCKRNIQRLTSSFMTLSLCDVATRVKLSEPADAEKYLLDMIEDGEIVAKINQKDGMVAFLDDSEKYNTPQMVVNLEEEIEACMKMQNQVLELEEKVNLTPLYIQKTSGLCDDDCGTGCTPKKWQIEHNGNIVFHNHGKCHLRRPTRG